MGRRFGRGLPTRSKVFIPRLVLAVGKTGTLAVSVSLQGLGTKIGAGIQHARPASDISNPGLWIPGPNVNAGQPLYEMVNEATLDATDFIISPAAPTAAVCKLRLSAVTDPASSLNHVLRYAIAKSNDGGATLDFTIRLLDGVTEIAVFSHINVIGGIQQFDQTLTVAQTDAITTAAYAGTLDVELTANATSGTGRRLIVYWIDFEVPSAGGVKSGTSTMGVTASLAGVGNRIIGQPTSTMAIQASLAGVGTKISPDAKIGVGSFAVTASLTGVGNRISRGTSVVAVQAKLTGVGIKKIVNKIGTGTLSAVAALTGTGSKITAPTVSLVSTYRIVIADLAGVELDEVPGKNLQFSYTLKAQGSVSFVLPFLHAKTLKSTLDPGKREVIIYRNGIKTWRGLLWDAEVIVDNEVRFNGEGYFSKFSRRYIDSDLPATGLSYNTDIMNIAWNLIDFTQAKANGNMGITRWNAEVPSGVIHQQAYCAWERKYIDRAILDLSEVSTGFDFEITPDKVWKAYAKKGIVRTDAVFEYGKNIRGMSYPVNARDTASDVTGLGAGSRDDTLIAVASDATAQAAFGRLERAERLGEVVESTELATAAQAELNLRKGQLIQPQFAIYSDDPPWGSYEVGDEVRVKVNKGYADLDRNFRIITITVNISNEGEEVFGLFMDEVVV